MNILFTVKKSAPLAEDTWWATWAGIYTGVDTFDSKGGKQFHLWKNKVVVHDCFSAFSGHCCHKHLHAALGLDEKWAVEAKNTAQFSGAGSVSPQVPLDGQPQKISSTQHLRYQQTREIKKKTTQNSQRETTVHYARSDGSVGVQCGALSSAGEKVFQAYHTI